MAEPAHRSDPQAEPESEVRYLPVPVRGGPIEAQAPRSIEPIPSAPLIAAAGGFVAGVATFVLARVVGNRSARRALARAMGRKRARGLEVAASRSFLVDVHLLKR